MLTSLISGWEIEEAPVHGQFVMKPTGSSVCHQLVDPHMCSKYRVKADYEGTGVAQTFMERVFAFKKIIIIIGNLA